MKIRRSTLVQKPLTVSVDSLVFNQTIIKLQIDTALCLIVDKCRSYKILPEISPHCNEFEKLVVSLAILSYQKDYAWNEKIYYWSMTEALKIFDKTEKNSPIDNKFWF